MSTTYLHVQQQLTTVEGFVLKFFLDFFYISKICKYGRHLIAF